MKFLTGIQVLCFLGIVACLSAANADDKWTVKSGYGLLDGGSSFVELGNEAGEWKVLSYSVIWTDTIHDRGFRISTNERPEWTRVSEADRKLLRATLVQAVEKTPNPYPEIRFMRDVPNIPKAERALWSGIHETRRAILKLDKPITDSEKSGKSQR